MIVRLLDAPEVRRLLVEQMRRLARKCVEVDVGTACFDDTTPHLYDTNMLVVDRPVESWDHVAAVAEDAHAAAGHAHRRVLVADPSAIEVTAPAAQAAGWQVDRWVAMEVRRPAEQPGDAGAAVEVDLAGFLRFEERSVVERPWVTTTALAAEVISHVERRADVLRARFLVTYAADGSPAAGCHLYPESGTLEVAEVVTLEPHRGQGHARALLARAQAEAEAAGAALFLWADAQDWPRRLYARLGYEPLAAVALLARPPAQAGAEP